MLKEALPIKEKEQKLVVIIVIVLILGESYYLPNYLTTSTVKDYLATFISIASGLFAIFIASFALAWYLLDFLRKNPEEIAVSIKFAEIEQELKLKDKAETLKAIENIKISSLDHIISSIDHTNYMFDSIFISGSTSLVALISSFIVYNIVILFEWNPHKIFLLIPQGLFLLSLIFLYLGFFHHKTTNITKK